MQSSGQAEQESKTTCEHGGDHPTDSYCNGKDACVAKATAAQCNQGSGASGAAR
jgi:hypothetical protein